VKATLFILTGIVAACGGAVHAQVAPAPLPSVAAVPDAPSDTQQAGSPSSAPAKPVADSRHDDIRMMESVLTQALQKGAQDLARQLRVNEPNSAFVTGTGRARGFILDGYGVFFDVDVPGMKQSVVWSAQMVQLMQDRERALQDLERLRPDDPLRKVAELQFRQIQRLIAAAQGGAVLVPSPVAPTQLAPQGLVGAATVPVTNESMVATPAAPPGPAAPAASPATEIRDPNELYTESVKNALIDAMLKYSAFLKIPDNEWLTVAASDSEGPQIPGQIDDASRILIRVKGADLAAFQAGRLTREEVLKKVEVREY
jgi:hypothetical protein